jgi:hypothetical protein
MDKIDRQTNKYKHHKTEKKENKGILLSIGIIDSDGGLWKGRKRGMILRAKELFWWLTERKYKLGRVVERGGGEMV